MSSDPVYLVTKYRYKWARAKSTSTFASIPALFPTATPSPFATRTRTMPEPITITIIGLAFAACAALTAFQDLLEKLVSWFKRRSLRVVCEKLQLLIGSMKQGRLLGDAGTPYSYRASLLVLILVPSRNVAIL